MMNTTYRRIALLTGASVAALGAASPAWADPYTGVAPHDTVPPGTYSGTAVFDITDPVVSTITICNIAGASPECFLGVKAEGPGVQAATVNTPLTGQIEQIGNSAAGPVTLTVVNDAGDIAEIGAVAFATAPVLGVAEADADLDSAIYQNGQGGDDVVITLDNNGTLLLDALAVATGTNALADAHVDYGVYQYASSTGGDAVVTVINDGNLHIGATATANGETNASATAIMHTGIYQSADAFGAGTAQAGVTNNVNLHIGAFASAVATTGAADAYASASGISQYVYATGGGDALATVANAGTLEIHAMAIADGTSYADASASVSGIYQSATAYDGGDAVNTVSNAALGVIDIAAIATASALGATGDAYASAEASTGIYQSANAFGGGTASNMVSNAGTMTIRAEAVANGATFASASASNSSAISQSAYATGGGDAVNTVDNDGTLSITAIATANATDGAASATASASSAIEQDATAYDGGDAVSLVANDGTLTIDAIANADAANGGSADASASNSDAIEQDADAYEGGDAFASITGIGTINIGATAIANAATVVVGTGTAAVVLPGGFADAYASVYNAISQSAYAAPLTTGDPGNATANISQGAINITALAMATGSAASATAYNDYGIEQYANADGGGDALASIDLGGGNINATATAVGTDGSADAYASVYYAISQTAGADMGGDATVSLANTGALTINAVANATAEDFASATAYNSNAIYQTAQASGQVDIDPGVGVDLVGGDASVSIDNSGDLAIGAMAAADGSAADAYASVSDAIYQRASAYGTGLTPVGGNATADIVNDGTIAINAMASAQATDGNAQATASNSSAIEQSATAYDGGDATVSLTGAGSIDIGALAIAVSTDAFGSAYASVSEAISQQAYAESGDAAAIISQAGGIDIHATALAGGSDAEATAYVEDAIYQSAYAPEGAATASITLGGDSNIVAIASVNATDKSGNAYASVDSAISQYAFAGDGNDATVNLTSTGTLTIGANAVALADETAFATAFVDGIYQSATAAGGGDATIAVVNDADVVIVANATATGASAYASAEVSYGWYQYALTYGTGTDPQGGDATVSLVNTGSITVGANADADATAGDATALAEVNTGVGQSAQAFDNGDASVSLDNVGALTVFASAAADAGNQLVGVGTTATVVFGDAFASASVESGVWQFASGLNGTATLDNAGTIDITASAIAGGGGDVGFQTTFAIGTATTVTFPVPGAQAHIDNGIAQVAEGNLGTEVVGVGTTATTVFVAGDALASINNDGMININANASATGTGMVMASATVDNGVAQYASADGGDATASMVNSGTIAIAATANANGGDAMGEVAVMTAGGTATAFAVPGAYASVLTGILQVATANPAATAFDTVVVGTGTTAIVVVFPTDALVGNASATLDNSGAITVDASANATATGPAYASAYVGAGIIQEVSADTIVLGFGTTVETVGGDASASLTNSGSIAVGAVANASGTSAIAVASANGIEQQVDADAGMASASFTNSGTVTVNGSANAIGSSLASASADAGNGVYQSASGSEVMLTADNSGSVVVSAVATASADSGPAFASAFAYNGIAQVGFGGDIVATITNSGTAAVLADAFASGAGTATASAAAASVLWQLAVGDTADVSMVNSGTATASANAVAVARGTVVGAGTTATTVGSAYASASAYGLGQIVFADTGTATMVNSGVLNVGAHATASGFTAAAASAYATGAYQTVRTGVDLAFTNSGAFNVNASAIAGGVATGTATDADITPATGSAYATAIGYNGFGLGGDALDVTVVNSGTMSVSATAIAPMTAEANAQGIILENAPTTTTVGTGTTAVVTVTGNPINGTLTNSGTLNVVASASGGTTVTGTGTTATTVAMSSANATGILIMSGANNMVVTNSGTITVDAITANGGDAEANGVVVEGNGDVVFSADDQFTFTNDGGTIVVRESEDGGATWRRGTAIDVSAAPNYSVINLLGDGEIYGNIDVAEGDDIFVEAGDTYFDGIINPECHEDYGGPGPAYDDPAVNACGQGTLTIQNGGNLILADSPWMGDETMYDGPSYVFVDTFNVGAEGTITFQLSPEDGGVQPLGSYPQVFADVANLDGTLVAEFVNTNESGLFDDSYFWNNVIDAEERNGTFDQCLITGINTDSPLLEFSGCIYDDMENVDLGLVRIAFDEVPGLTRNQGSVAGGIECLYDDLGPDGLEGTAFGDLVGELFLFDSADYPQALEQLTGAGYAGYLQSFNSLGYHYNQILARATDCEIPALAGSALACRVAPMHLWGQIDYDTLSQDGDVELGDYDADRWSFLIGGDISVTPAAVVGASIGKVTNKVSYDDIDTRIKGDGWQFGLYGTYDPGQFYVKALGTYTKMDGDARRSMDFTEFGGTISGEMEGDPDVRLWTFGLHGGYRIPMGPTSVITPFLNYDYTDAKLKGFTEDGVEGANLTVNGGREKHSWLTGGVKWAGQMGGLVPEAMVGYRHMFGDRRASFNANFAGFEENCDFDIVSMTEKRGALLAGLSIGGLLGMVDVRVGYNGAFNSDMQEHSGFLKLVVPLGAVAAPPPPPMVVAPPPPPPAPATQTCPDGSVILATDICPAPPPPPPPPAPAPERG